MRDLTAILYNLKHGDIASKQGAREQLATVSRENIQFLVTVVAQSEEQMISTVLEGYDWEEGEGGQRHNFNVLRDTISYDFWYIAAISELLKNAGSLAVEVIVSLLNHSKPLVRAWAAHQLGIMGDEVSIEPLISRLNTANSQERYRIIEALGRLRATKAVELLIAFLEDGEVDGVAAEALGRIGDLRAVPPLIKLLKKHKPSVYSASAALHYFGKDAVFPLVEVLFDEQAHQVHDLVLMGLWMIGDERAVDPILNFLQRTQDVKIRRSAISALGNLKAQNAVEPIVEILQNASDSDLRWRAAWALAQIGGKKAFAVLVETLENDTLEMQREVVLAFGEMEFVEDIQPILTALKHSDHYVRSGAAVALGNLKDKRALDALTAALNDSDEATRRFASDALTKIAQANT